MNRDPAVVPATSRRRRPWVIALAVLIAAPLILFGALVILLGLRMRSASALARGLCAEFTVGAATSDAALARRARSLGLRVDLRSTDSGRSLLEARSGVLTATYLCAIEVQDGRVASSRYVQED